MGMFDKILADPVEKEKKFSDFMTAMIPIVGPFLARSRMDKRQEKKQRAFTDSIDKYIDDDPLSRRVAERMLSRTGESTIPGIMAATEATRQAQDPGNMGNMGNVLMNTATKLQGRGVPGALNLAQVAHKQVQTPWKPEEGGRKIINFKMPDGSIKTATNAKEAEELVKQGGNIAGVTSAEPGLGWEAVSGSDIGLKGQAAGDSYFVKRDPKDPNKILEVKSADKMTVNVAAPDLGVFSDAKFGPALQEFRGYMTSYVNARENNKQLLKLIKPGTAGWGGAVASLGDRLKGAAEFIKSIPGGEQRAVAKYMTDPRMKGFISRISADGVDANRARALAVKIAYDIARSNNSTESGGRGITDADMEFAMQMVGMTGSPESFRQVMLDYDKRLEREYKSQAPLKYAELSSNEAGEAAIPEAHKQFYRDTFNFTGGDETEAKDPNAPMTEEEVRKALGL